MKSQTHPDSYDLCIIGGGINGAGIARDAAGRGLKVLLVEQGDLAQATSSASTKLIHGGLRYLEYYEFGLVKHSLEEREVLLRLAPHIIWPLTFVLPLRQDLRPTWLIRAGLFLYDHLAMRNSLPKSRFCRLRQHVFGDPLQDSLERGFSYSDCWVEDARLVVLNAQDAADKGATILTRTRCQSLVAKSGTWEIGLKDMLSGREEIVKSRFVVNAAGPWVKEFLDTQELSTIDTPGVRLVQGSHLIVPRLYDGEQAYILQQQDGRIVFAIPYEKKFTLIGTTETLFKGDPLKAEITAQEIDYLLSAANEAFKKQLGLSDIVKTYSGVRPLFDDQERDAKAVTRDYFFHETDIDGAWLLSVFGGKLTTYRRLAEQVTNRVQEVAGGAAQGWTADKPLPGGAVAGKFDDFILAKMKQYEHIPAPVVCRLARAYGSNIDVILKVPGYDLGDGIYEAELRYLIQNEYALTAEDILWRRSKLDLHISEATRRTVHEMVPQLVREITGHDTHALTGD